MPHLRSFATSAAAPRRSERVGPALALLALFAVLAAIAAVAPGRALAASGVSGVGGGGTTTVGAPPAPGR